ncbi:hypothetical protein WICPIJ_008783 [Wickerhamomyces pijperi]|uniref:Uncharacterized protein n=1 Tax=Wickerhamomyces pijperi TaxID=599730 RepID=A0A9P8THE8_WICPI|nr:hypothetical protein WICPIJ_008783 [Wickerhamomyces pijperi]
MTKIPKSPVEDNKAPVSCDVKFKPPTKWNGKEDTNFPSLSRAMSLAKYTGKNSSWTTKCSDMIKLQTTA